MHLPQKGIIELDHVSLGYDNRPLLRDICLEVDEGDFMAITGPNGGGKTTLLKLMLKLIKPDNGKVIYRREGAVVDKLPIGYLPQKSMIDTKFPITVEETVLTGLLSGLSTRLSDSQKQRLEDTIALTGIGELRKRPIGTLSGGQLQRTLLARAIISDPKIVVLDEPLSYVDKQFERRIYGLMEQLAQRATIILVSHEMSIISSMANRHIIVDHGIHSCSALHHYIPGECQ